MRHDHFKLSFIDLLLNLAVTFTALFMLSVIVMNDPKKQQDHNADERAKVMIIMEWSGPAAPDDVDLWLSTPEPAKIGYNSPNNRVANLERDDLGKMSNQYKDAAGKVHYQEIDREVITIRQWMEGHYVVNAYLYGRHSDPETGQTPEGPDKVSIQLIQVDPKYTELAKVQVDLVPTRPGNEVTAFSFDVQNSQVVNVDTTKQDLFVTRDYQSEFEGYQHADHD